MYVEHEEAFRKKETQANGFAIRNTYKLKMSWADDVMLRVITVDRGRIEKKSWSFRAFNFKLCSSSKCWQKHHRKFHQNLIWIITYNHFLSLASLINSLLRWATLSLHKMRKVFVVDSIYVPYHYEYIQCAETSNWTVEAMPFSFYLNIFSPS